MPTMIFRFSMPPNESLQAGDGSKSGDKIYYCPTTSHGGFTTVDNANHISTGIIYVGRCTNITQQAGTNMWEIHALIDPTLPLPQQTMISANFSLGYFLMFTKSTLANQGSLLGYYASVTFGNDSPDKAELYMISSEVSESSK